MSFPDRFSAAIRSEIEIKRDRAGIPHIYAATAEDLFFGLGVATAQDRLWQIDRLRRRALGEQAEVLGAAYVGSDIAHLTVGIDQIAAREVAATDPVIRALLEAYVAGINRTIEVLGLDLPPEFRHLGYQPAPFTVRDVIAIGRGIWWSLNGRIDRLAAAEAATFLPNDALRTLYLTPEAAENLVCPCETLDRSLSAGTDDCTGSNNWALRPERTGTGHAILCGDPHQPFWVPSSWYEYALHGPEDDAAGAGHPGFPGMWWGYNGRIAWAITNNMASTRDLYREEVHPSDPSLYRENGGWQRFGERTVTIRVKGEADRTVTIRSTSRGPIVNDLITPVAEGGDPPLSLRWVGAEHLDDVRASINISRARDWCDFRDVLKDWAVAVFNFVYADSEGNVGYQMAGRLPVRGRITYGFRDAANEEDSWRGYIPFDDLPRQYNPDRGYVASANQRIVAPDYPHPIYGAYSQGHRGVRLDQVFGAPGPHDHPANIRVQNDVKNCRAERWAPHIVRHLAGTPDSDARLVADALAGWDYEYTLASAAPTLFESFMALWTRHVLAVHLPARLLDLTVQQTNLGAAVLSEDWPTTISAKMAGLSPAMTGLANYFRDGTKVHVAAVAREAVAALRDRLGSDPAGWAWDRVHIAYWHHPLGVPEWDIGPGPMTGGSHTLRNSGGELPPHSANSGAEYRMVVDFAQPDRFLAVQNIGNSGVPGSVHYRDQFQAWIDGTYHTVHLRPEGVESDTVSITRITPG